MDRLTERTNMGIVGNNESVKNYPLYKVAEYDELDHGITGQCFEKLAEYEDLEEQGLLLRLPCKVGTKVYAINRIIDYGEVGDEATYSYSIIEREFQIYMMMEYGELVFGKTVFLTKVEAEQKLKEIESKQWAYEQGIKNFVEWYDKHENKEGFPYTVGNIKTYLSSEGILREFNIAMDNQIN